jgi:heme-degrading monooxygenase HmoA
VVISVTRFRSPGESFLDEATAVLGLLAARPGYLRGSVGRSTDDPEVFVLLTEWQDVGSYRRGLSAYEVKAGAWELLGRALPEPGSYEVLVRVPDESGRD